MRPAVIFIRKFVRNYPFTSLLSIAIWIACLVPVPETPLAHVALIDKWTHIAFYLVLGWTIVGERMRNYNSTGWMPMLLFVWLLPSLMGGLIEIVQAYGTGGVRSGEWLDFLADGVGATLAAVSGIPLARWRARG